MDIEQMRAEATSHGDRSVVVSRTFEAPRADVFRAWTDARVWAQWFAPEPLTVPRAETDPRPGGRYTFVMRDPEGQDYESRGEYLEVDEPALLVYSESSEAMPRSFTDMVNELRGEPAGTPIPEGMATVTFEETDGRTRMTFSEEFDSRSTRDAWVQLQMVEGLSAGFDQLDRILRRAPVTE